MNVYLYQSGTQKELKNDYIGEYKGYNLDIDFRTVSKTDLINAGWSIPSAVSLSSSTGMSSSGWGTPILTPSGLNVALQTATKITFTMLSNQTSASSREGDYALTTDDSSYSTAGFYGNFEMIRAYKGTNNTYSQYSKYATSTSDYTVTATYDLVNKTVQIVSSGINLSETFTLTDTQIAEIRASTSIKIRISSQRNIKTISVKVE